MCKLANRYVVQAALPKDWNKADVRAVQRLHKAVEKMNAQLENLSKRGILVEIRQRNASGT